MGDVPMSASADGAYLLDLPHPCATIAIPRIVPPMRYPPMRLLSRCVLAFLGFLQIAGFVSTNLTISAQDKKDDAKKENGKKDEVKKDDAKKDDAKKDDKKEDKKDLKEEPKKEPFVADIPINEMKGHADWINVLVYSSDGKQIATGSRDRTVKIWDVEQAKDITTLKGHPDTVKGVVFLGGG